MASSMILPSLLIGVLGAGVEVLGLFGDVGSPFWYFMLKGPSLIFF